MLAARLLIFVLLLLTACTTVPAQKTPVNTLPKPKNYVCYRAAVPPSLDGRLTDPAWEAAPWTTAFVDIEGDTKPRPRFRTRAKMLWDDTYFYIGVAMEEPHLWATLTEHDSIIFQDNDFEIFIDPDGDNHQYYEIEINALNTTWDLRLVKPYRDGGPALNEWEIPGMKTAVHLDGTLNKPDDKDKGWSVEFALPWKALGQFANCPAPPKHGDQWRINFSRVEWETKIVDGKYHKVEGKREDNWVWSPMGVVDMHRPERWGFVQFSSASPGSDRFRPDPSLPLRDFLMHSYHAQHAFHKTNGKYAATFAELGLSNSSIAGLVFPPDIRLTPDGYEITARRKRNGIPAEIYHLRQDSRLWVEN